jgi:hypothetical protein
LLAAFSEITTQVTAHVYHILHTTRFGKRNFLAPASALC